MVAAAILRIKGHAIKWAITTQFLMKYGAQTEIRILSSKIAKADV
jgi:hypothetical protein